MSRLEAIGLLCVAIAFLISAITKLSVHGEMPGDKTFHRMWLALRVNVALITICCCVLLYKMILEADNPEGLRKDIFIAFVLVLVAMFVLVASGICTQTMRLLGEVKSMHALAHCDPLTGVYNRRYFDKALGETIHYATVLNEPLALIAIDIDHFKRINDSFGHAFGDDVIRRVCETMAGESRSRDSIVRLGGDELVIIAPATGSSAACLFAERLRMLVENLPLKQLQMIGMSISIGVAIYQKGETTKGFVERADQALYRSKQTGRNRVTLAKPVLLGSSAVRGIEFGQKRYLGGGEQRL